MSDARLECLLDRIAVAVEKLAGISPAAVAAASPLPPAAAKAPAAVAEKKPLTLDQLKTVSAPFKATNQTVLCKEALNEIGANSIAELTTYAQQARYLMLVKDKATLLPDEQKNTAIAAIAILTI